MDAFRGKTIYLRLMEPQDYEITYNWRNDYNIQKMTCGPVRFISKEMEKEWANNRSKDNTSNIYISICAITDDRMIGYMSINEINYINRSCLGGGIVIGDKEYRDGTAYIEAELMEYDYVFNQLNMNRFYAECLDAHIFSRSSLLAMNFTQEGRKRQAIYKNGRYYDVLFFALLREDYFDYLNKGGYNTGNIIKQTARYAKEIKKELNSIEE